MHKPLLLGECILNININVLCGMNLYLFWYVNKGRHQQLDFHLCSSFFFNFFLILFYNRECLWFVLINKGKMVTVQKPPLARKPEKAIQVLFRKVKSSTLAQLWFWSYFWTKTKRLEGTTSRQLFPVFAGYFTFEL